jgi:hypothetical protein
MSKHEPRILEDVSTTTPVEEQEVEHVEGESKEDAFKRLASSRVNKALKMIALIGNLSSAQYSSTSEQHDAIERALLVQVAATMRKLRKVKTEVQRFEL